VQIADDCVITQDTDGMYFLESSKFHEDTEWFTDRPFQFEKTQPTKEWFEGFDELFNDGNGMPNAALTFVDKDTSKDIVVSVFAEGYIKNEGGDDGDELYGYKLKQSESQASIVSLKDLMSEYGALKVFDHCSMFIDIVWVCSGD